MKTPASSSSAPVRLAWIACAAIALSACTGPGLEPPDQSNNSAGGPGKVSDAGAQQHGGSGTDSMGSTGTGGRSSTGGSTGGKGGSAGSSGGTSGENGHPMTPHDAGLAPDAGTDAGDEDAG